MVTGPRYPKDRITDDEEQWLEEAREPDKGPRTSCCAKCRRGTRAFGELPCGYLLNCPNGCHD